MKNKFEEFYLEDDKNYPADVYWDLYDKDHYAAMSKYDGRMYCPLCKCAPLTVAKGEQRRYFKVVESDMDKHDKECSYRRKKGTKRDTVDFYKDLDKTDIRNRLVSCMNRMLKKTIRVSRDKGGEVQEKNKSKIGFLDFTTERGEKKYLPSKNLYSRTLEDDMEVQKIYYGECALYIVKYIPEGEQEVKKYYLKVLNMSTKKLICDISISPYVYDYLRDELVELPEDKNNAERYYICFSGILEKGKYTYNCRLIDSRLLVIEKA